MNPLSDVLPRFDVRELHQLRVDHSPAAAVDRMLSAPAAPDLTTRLLFAIRGIRDRDGTISDLLRGLGEQIRRREAEVVFLRSRRRITIAVAIWAEEAAGGSVLRTETRVQARGARARRAFRVYWFFIGPFSARIRRRWLRAAANA